MSTATAGAPAATPDPLRFSTGARERPDGVFYDETVTLGASSVVMPEAKVPVGNWLQHVDVLVTITAVNAGGATDVALEADAPWSAISEIVFRDAGGSAVTSLGGYNFYLVNLLGGYTHQTDPTASPFYSALETGVGATGGSGSFLLRLPVEIINRDAIGAYPNGASNAAVRVAIIAAPLATIYSTAPNGAVTMNAKMISQGYVLPSVASPTGRPYAEQPRGAGSFQQWSQIAYDLTTGRRTVQHVRKGNVYRTLLFVARDSSGDRSNSVLTEFEFSVDDVANLRGPWTYCRHITWQRQGFPAANLPAGVVQVSYAHEWDGKVGGELRDSWIPTEPGSKVEMELEVAATSTLHVITNEIVTTAGDGVLRV